MLAIGVIRRVLPDAQRRTAELTDDRDLTTGDAASLAFCMMLTLSAVIASAGVLTDSAATVIGATIIAPLSTPIMGSPLGIAKRDFGAAGRSALVASGGVVLVVGIGVLIDLIIPSTFGLLGNRQITCRTSRALAIGDGWRLTPRFCSRP